jgi:hypothetical protein
MVATLRVSVLKILLLANKLELIKAPELSAAFFKKIRRLFI